MTQRDDRYSGDPANDDCRARDPLDRPDTPRRRRPWGLLVAIVGIAIGAPFAFGAIKVPVPDAAKLNQGSGRAVLAGTVSAAVPAGAVRAVPAGTLQAPPCANAAQSATAAPPPGTITRAQPAGTITRAQPAGSLPAQ